MIRIAAANLLLLALLARASFGEEPLKVCATVPELGSLVRIVGGADVSVTVFAKGSEDPHFVEARPSFVTALAKADALAVVGLELEIGWAPARWEQSRNARILPGAAGHWDASRGLSPLEVPAGPVDRSMGDVHPGGNPHYLLDPLEGLRAAERLRDGLTSVRPSRASEFEANLSAFRKALGEKLVGVELHAKYDGAKLARLHAHGKLREFLAKQGDEGKLGGWLGLLAPFQGTAAVDDHALWPYFARAFGLKIAEHLEPLPGVSPTSRHLARVVKRMQEERIALLITSAYYDPKSAEMVARQTGARIARLAHQAGAYPQTGEYIEWLDFNVKKIHETLSSK